jgi:hypothetical protein
MEDVTMHRKSRVRWIAFGSTLVTTALVAGSVALGCARDFENRLIPPEEAGATKEAGNGDVNTSQACPSEMPPNAKDLEYKPPNPPQTGKCHDDDIAAMKDFILMNPKATNEDFENFVKNRDTTCHDCIFGDSAGATWPPAPLKDGKVLTFDVGACYAIVTGSPVCGMAVQNAWDCEFDACSLCPSVDVVERCRAKARTGVCKTYEDAAHVSCTGFAADQQCGSPFDSIRVECITTAKLPTDGGTDASDAGDAGDGGD